MTISEEIKKLRQRNFLSQEAFAKEIDVSYSTVNRWETGKTKPNLNAMKSIKDFCLKSNTEFETLENLWLDLELEDKNND